MPQSELPRPLVVLGLAGIAPQALCLGMALLGGPFHWVAIAAGCFYAALILSFLGGLWWMAGLLAGDRRAAPYVLAVVPSLAAWAALLPWAFGWRWPGPSLGVLGLLLLLSPLADLMLARSIAVHRSWLSLRVTMASGLGLLSLALAVV